MHIRYTGDVMCHLTTKTKLLFRTCTGLNYTVFGKYWQKIWKYTATGKQWEYN